jgi:hypothetical protein
MRALSSALLGLVACGGNRLERDTDWCPEDFKDAAHEGFADAVCTYVQHTCPGTQPELAAACSDEGEAGVVEYFSHLGDCVIPCNVPTCYRNLTDAIDHGRCDPSAFYDPPDVCQILYPRFRDDSGNLTCGDAGGVYWSL